MTFKINKALPILEEPSFYLTEISELPIFCYNRGINFRISLLNEV